jgi:carboxyl-terminal processing protease
MQHLIFKFFFIFSVFFSTSFSNLAFSKNKEASTLPEKADISFYHAIKSIALEGYVDEVKEEDFIYNSLNGGLQGMDPHSAYISPKDYKKFRETIQGEFSGVGIQITSENGFIKVIAPIDDTPAAKAGIKTGDYITHINGENTYQISTEEAAAKMRGKDGTKVKLVILRPMTETPVELELTRAKIKSKSVSISSPKDNILVIRISNFLQSTGVELKEELKKIKDDKKGIIIDLRNNPGGVLEQSIIISNFFLENNKTIVSVKGRKREFYKPSEANGKGKIIMGCVKENQPNCVTIGLEQKQEETIFFSNGESLIPSSVPIVILINKGSASASEILAGALKDNNRAVLVGEISFGKGVVQSIIPIKNGEMGALKLTTSRYYTPNGTSIQAVGITPDIIAMEASITPKENKLQSLFSVREQDLKNHTVSAQKLDEVAQKSQKYKKEEEAYKKLSSDFQILTAINIIEALNKNSK